MVTRNRTKSKTWVYQFESTPWGVQEVLSTFGFGGSDPKGQTSILTEDGWQPFYSSKNNEEVRSFRFTFEGSDSRVRSMLRNAATAVRHDTDYEYQHQEHDEFESFAQQMKEQGFPRASV